MSKKIIEEIVSYFLIITALVIIIFGVSAHTKIKILREQEQIRHEQEVDFLEEYYFLLVEFTELETYTEFLEEKINVLYDRVLENNKNNDKLYIEYIDLIVEYFNLDTHTDKDSFELWLFNNHRELYEWLVQQ